MQEFLKYQRKLILVIAALAAVGCIVLSHYYPTGISGWIVGSLIGIFIFHKRVRSIVILPSLPQDEWAKESIKSNMITYVIIIGAVVASIYIKQIDSYAVLAGILLERVILRADGWIRPGALSDVELDEAAGEAN
ncbi:MAG: hypothetical protein ACYTFY_04535 [Planctomycetota bacterium]|jgi:hypothetical protein